MLGIFFPSQAVTQKEMDQARALATKAYLRYANDGSGYLDEITPQSMADLEKQLKAKEKENIKAFKSIPVPSGYESWTKEQLVEYWGKAFSTSGLLEKGRAGRSRAKKYIGEMTVSAPAKPAEKPQNEEKPAPAQKEAKEEPAPAKTETVPASPTIADVDSMQATLDKAEAIVESGISAVEPDPQVSKVKDHSVVYIIILIVLVAAVIALVVFASNVMKRNAAAARKKGEYEPESAIDPSRNAKIIEAQLKEKYSEALAAKNREITNLARQLESALAQSSSMRKEMDSLKAEILGLRSRLASATRQAAPEQPQSAAAPSSTTHPQPTAAQTAPDIAPQPLRTIYLGKVNAKGIFIRADRNLSVGNSIYRLDTTDGFSGTFRVVSDPTVCEMALLTPRESLAGGCTGADLENTAGFSKIVTDSAGTAILDNKCWRVSRKAKIHYE